jgi:Icc-related predicted phosphoesterase
MHMNKKLRIAAIGDIHVGRTHWGPYDELFREISGKADVLILCGDLTNYGLPEEAELLATQLQACSIPIIGVLGNHDYQSGKKDTLKQILTQGKMVVLEDEPFEIQGVGFAGTKGFAGGFGQHMLGSFGEEGIKQFVQEAVNETLRLEGQLSTLESEKKIVLLHYSPVKDTLVGEPEEIFPYLGSSRLSEPIDNYNVTAVFHGHAHHGTHEGKTLTGIPVYNVSYPLMQKRNEKHPYALIEI